MKPAIFALGFFAAPYFAVSLTSDVLKLPRDMGHGNNFLDSHGTAWENLVSAPYSSGTIRVEYGEYRQQNHYMLLPTRFPNGSMPTHFFSHATNGRGKQAGMFVKCSEIFGDESDSQRNRTLGSNWNPFSSIQKKPPQTSGRLCDLNWRCGSGHAASDQALGQLCIGI